MLRAPVGSCQYHGLLILFAGALVMGGCTGAVRQPDEQIYARAAQNGRVASEGFRRAHRYMVDWLAHADSATGLIPRNLNDDRFIWNASDAGADNYPFMVMTASMTDRQLYDGRMREMLQTERSLTSRLGPLPDTYSFRTDRFVDEEPDLGGIIFGASEYVKDGLLPLTEWLGPTIWSERMIELVDGIWERAPVETAYGAIPSRSDEINGEMLQVLSRLYWMTADDRYLEWAIRLGDYYLLGDNHPTRDAEALRLRDHGCEIVSGLTELYATVHFARPAKKAAYREPVHAMLDRILEVGRNEHGLFYNAINPRTGETIDDRPADTFGYTYNGYYTVYMIDSTEAYLAATRRALGSLYEHYEHYSWEGGSADGDADAIESALNLYNRERIASAADWIDREIQFMWSKQDSSHQIRRSGWNDSGIIEGWHGDGNFARTTLYYCLWKTRGLQVRPWREDVIVGAARDSTGRLAVFLSADSSWTGRLHFDIPRHTVSMRLPLDWPRINQFPEWFTVASDRTYTILDLAAETRRSVSGDELERGFPIELTAGEAKRLVVVE